MEAMKSEYPIAAMTEALEVSRSGFFAHQRKGEKPRRQEDRVLAERIRPIFGASRQTYGSPRVTAALRQAGQPCGKNRVARLMRENHLRPKQKRRRWRPQTTDSNHACPVAENWLAKVPAPARPDQVWVADITYLDTAEGWLYLAGLLDGCSRRCVGWQTGESLEATLVTQAWQKACRDRRPEPGLLHHSDRGVQYASGAMAALLAESGAAASMSRKANCYDNALMESF
jgi:putative transposase